MLLTHYDQIGCVVLIVEPAGVPSSIIQSGLLDVKVVRPIDLIVCWVGGFSRVRWYLVDGITQLTVQCLLVAAAPLKCVTLLEAYHTAFHAHVITLLHCHVCGLCLHCLAMCAG